MRVCRTCSVFFLSVKTAGENSLRVHRTCSVFFFPYETAGENSMRDLAGNTTLLTLLNF